MVGGNAAQALKGYVERIERLNEDKKALLADISMVFNEAKSTGFDPKTMRQLIRLRAMSAHDRAEQEALLEIYMGALGMLDDPLGENTRRRLTPPADTEDDIPSALTPPPAPPPADDVSVDQAREMGAAAARMGTPITANPFPPNDPRRAAWDEAWCAAAGNDGMDIPEAWRRRKAPKKPDADTEPSED